MCVCVSVCVFTFVSVFWFVVVFHSSVMHFCLLSHIPRHPRQSASPRRRKTRRSHQAAQEAGPVVWGHHRRARARARAREQGRAQQGTHALVLWLLWAALGFALPCFCWFVSHSAVVTFGFLPRKNKTKKNRFFSHESFLLLRCSSRRPAGSGNFATFFPHLSSVRLSYAFAL